MSKHQSASLTPEPRKPKSPREFEEFFHIGHTKFHQLINGGQLRITKLGRRTLVMPADEDAFVASLPRVSGAAS